MVGSRKGLRDELKQFSNLQISEIQWNVRTWTLLGPVISVLIKEVT